MMTDKIEIGDGIRMSVSSSPNIHTEDDTWQGMAMSFNSAIDHLLAGERITRLAWENSGTYIQLTDDNHLRIYKPETKQFHDLIVQRGDLEAIDWVVM